LDEAVIHLQRALELQPDFPNALNNLGVAFVQMKKIEPALALFQKAVQLQRDLVEAHNNLGRLQLQNGNVSEAIVEYQAALRFRPDDPDALCNLAWVLAACPRATFRDGSRAVELASQANRISRPSPAILGTLAAALAEEGQYSNAVATVQEALSLADAQSNPELARRLRSQLNQFEAGLPIRDNSMTPDMDRSAAP